MEPVFSVLFLSSFSFSLYLSLSTCLCLYVSVACLTPSHMSWQLCVS